MVVIKPTLSQLKGIDIMVLAYKMLRARFYTHLLTALYNGLVPKIIPVFIFRQAQP
jgi:hypothetical protein